MHTVHVARRGIASGVCDKRHISQVKNAGNQLKDVRLIGLAHVNDTHGVENVLEAGRVVHAVHVVAVALAQVGESTRLGYAILFFSFFISLCHYDKLSQRANLNLVLFM